MRYYNIGFIHTPYKEEHQTDKRNEIENLLRMALDAHPAVTCHIGAKRPADKMVFDVVQKLKTEGKDIETVVYIGYSDEVRELTGVDVDNWYAIRSGTDDEELLPIDRHIDTVSDEQQKSIQKAQHEKMIDRIAKNQDAYITLRSGKGRSYEQKVITALEKEPVTIIPLMWDDNEGGKPS